MLLLNQNDIRRAFSMRDAIESNKTAFSMASRGEFDMPLRTVIPQGLTDAQFIIMPAYSKKFGAMAVKVVNVFPENLEKGLDTCPAKVMLCDGETGYTTAILDGESLTKIRTGASTGVAFELLGKKNCRKGALIGTGGQASAQLEAMLTVRGPEEVWVYSRNEKRCREFCEKMQVEFARFGTDIKPAATAEEAVADADLIVTVTTSATPVFDGSHIKPGCTISCVGTYTPDKHELDPAVLLKADKIICDYKDAALAETGDLLIPIAQGLLSEGQVLGSIGDVLNGTLPGRESDEEIIVYETVGAAPQDLCAAMYAYQKALELGIGINWE